MTSSKDCTSQRISLALDAFVAAYCFLVVYSTITSFERPTPWYHAEVSYELILAASVLFLPFIFMSGWRVERLVLNWKPWVAVCLCLGLATLFAADPVVSVHRLRLIYSVLLIGFVFKAWFSRSRGAVIPMVMLALALVHAAILTLVLVAYDRASGSLWDFSSWLPYHAHIRHLGYHGMAAAASGLAFGLLVPRFRLVGLFLSVFALFGLIFFGSRGAVLSWMAFVAVATFFCADRKRLLLMAVGTLFVAWVAAAWVSSLKADHLGTAAERSMSTASVDSRLALWRDALVAIKDRPLLGYGPEGYASSRCCVPGNIQTHNAVFEIAIECGVLGLLAFAWLAKLTIGQQILCLWRQRKKGEAVSPVRALLVSMILGSFAFSMIDGIFYHVIPLLIFSILCALLFSISEGREPLLGNT